MKKNGLPAKLYRGITSPLRLMPDFLIIGGQKCGTTSLYRYLAGHPGIVPAARKEPHFFDTKKYLRGRLSYRSYFPSAPRKYYANLLRKKDFVTGEATTYYMFHPLVPGRVAEAVPQARLIALLRNPVDRAYSQYQSQARKGKITLSFEEAIEREAERLEGEKEKMLRDGKYHSFDHQLYSYLARGIYVDQLEAWRKSFPEESFLILKSEDLYEDPSPILERALDFLGLPFVEPEEGYGTHNEGYYTGEMDPATRRRLVDHFRPHNERLYEYLGVDLRWDR